MEAHLQEERHGRVAPGQERQCPVCAPVRKVEAFIQMVRARRGAVYARTVGEPRSGCCHARLDEETFVVVVGGMGRRAVGPVGGVEPVQFAGRRQVQLADEVRLVARFREFARQRWPGERGRVVHEDPVGCRALPGHQRPACGDTDRCCAVGVTEAGACGGQRVEVRRLQDRMAFDAEGVAALLIGHQQQDVGTLVAHLRDLEGVRQNRSISTISPGLPSAKPGM